MGTLRSRKSRCNQWFGDSPVLEDIKRQQLINEYYRRDNARWEAAVIPTEFYNAVAKEFNCDPEHLKMAKVVVYPGSAPMLELTIELNAQQAKALHWIREEVK